MKKVTLAVPILILFLASIPFSVHQSPATALAASSCGPLAGGHMADGNAPTVFCEDGKPFLDTHITGPEEIDKPCPVPRL